MTHKYTDTSTSHLDIIVIDAVEEKKETFAISHPQITDQAATIDAVLRFFIQCMCL